MAIRAALLIGVAAVAAGWLGLHRGATSAHAPAMLKATAIRTSAYGRLPLSFEANRGQFDRRARFVARGADSSTFLTRGGAVMAFRHAALRMSFAGAGAATPRGSAKLPGTVSSLIGSDRSKWVHGAPTYARVAYPHVWNGIDGVFHGHGSRLEYDLRVAPGADPSAIRLRFAGQRRLRVAGNGDLVLDLPGGGTVRQLAPVSYQPVHGRRTAVPSRFVLGSHGLVGITVGDYDHQRPLVVDPTLVYGTYLGGAGDDVGRGIAVGTDGSTYLTGTTTSTDFPTTAGVRQQYPGGAEDAFVVKLDPTGTAETYCTYLGGTEDDEGRAIAVDDAGHAFVTGSTRSVNFPTTPGTVQPAPPGGLDAFAVKLTPNGSDDAYGTFLGGSSDDAGFGIAVDTAGRAYLTGYTASNDLPTTPGALEPTRASHDLDAYGVRLDSAGAQTYGTYLGGSADDVGYGIAVDTAGSAYLTGYTASTDLPTTPGALQPAHPAPDLDAFAVKLDPSGGQESYGTYLGGSDIEVGQAIAVDGSGSAYLTGNTSSPDFPTTAGALKATHAGHDVDAYVAKLDPAGSQETYGTYLGGTGDEDGLAIAVDSTGSAFIAGDTYSKDFPTTPGALIPNRATTDQDAFAVQLRPMGTAEAYGSYLGGSGDETGLGIAADPAGSAYVTGGTDSNDFPTTAGALQPIRTSTRDTDAFAVKLATPTAVHWRGGRARVLRHGGVRLTWQTGRDPDTLGFEVVRLRRGKRVRVSRHLIPGGAIRARTTFGWTDARGRPGDRYVVITVGTDGSREAHRGLVARRR